MNNPDCGLSDEVQALVTAHDGANRPYDQMTALLLERRHGSQCAQGYLETVEQQRRLFRHRIAGTLSDRQRAQPPQEIAEQRPADRAAP